MEYLGEHLLPGKIGNFFATLSFVSSLVATIAYFIANKQSLDTEKKGWLRIGRIAFFLESISVIAIFSTLYYIISHHLFEYKYAWQHSDRSLQVEYLLSCFWEGQEGSFLLWSFWHCVLGWILIWKSKQWEAGTMTVISFAQFCLASMTIGLYFFESKLGSSPFVFLRDQGILDNAPIFKDPATGFLRADYLNLVKDGTGLNTLLQNYWMVIHPPILFLGFASTIVPFAFAYAGFVQKDHSWTKAVLPWSAFSIAVLGLGIMMGAMWAYESLSFGGYWAWDPVENASLVPWLTLVAGLHVNLVYKNSGYSLRSTYFFYFISFILILYSTFLTRSGVLGDTSVHAFTDLGMNIQLYFFLSVFVWLPVFFISPNQQTKLIAFFVFAILSIISYKYASVGFLSITIALVWYIILINKHIPTIKKEENTYSREFWMFIGALVLFLSAFVISAITSLPVFNKLVNHVSLLKSIFKNAFAQPEDVEFTHNQIQVFVAIIIGLLTATTQFFKYKDTPPAAFTKKILVPTIIAVVGTLLISIFGNIAYNKQGPAFLIAIHLAVFAALYSVIANAAYIFSVLKGKVKLSGPSVAHIGFGLILLGVLISSSKKTVLSWNTTGITPLKATKQENPAENLTLFKGQSTDMGKYMVTYVGDTLNTKDRKRYFEIDFKPKTGNGEGFKVYPDVIKNNKGAEGFAANPAAMHYWYKDIFVYITSFQENNREDTVTFRNREMKVGDTSFYGNGLMILNKVSVNPQEQKSKYADDETALFLDMTVISKDGRRYAAKPGIAIKQQQEIRAIADTVVSQSLVLKFNKVIDQQTGVLEIGVKESSAITDLLTLKVLEFPMINLLWMGVIVMVIGCVMSIYQRVKRG